MNITLIWLNPLTGERRSQPTALPATIGRDQEATLTLDSARILPIHVHIVNSDGVVVLQLAYGAGGVRLNGEPVTAPEPLENADRIEVGPFTLSVWLDADAASAAELMSTGSTLPGPALPTAPRPPIKAPPPALSIDVGRNLDVEGDIIAGDKIAGDQLVAGRDAIKAETYIAKQVFVVEAKIREIEDLPPEPGEAPFKGLQYFTEEDTDLFFGRDRLITQLTMRFHVTNFLAVVGASGSGKSSLVRAGIIPALKGQRSLEEGNQPPSGRWRVHTITPTARPLDSLANCLSESLADTTELHDALKEQPDTLLRQAERMRTKNGDDHFLLFVDQFEELFTLARREQDRIAFIENLVTAAFSTDSRVKVVLTVRADFYGQCLQYDNLRRALRAFQEPLGAMSREEQIDAIVQPAALGDWKFQEGLVDLMLDEVGSEPGALPLLSHALLETWQRRRGRTMTLSGYHEAGGVRGAIAQTAESVFQQRLSEEQQPIARMIFLRLTELGEGTQDTRRRIPFSELISRSTDPIVIESVLRILTDARLVVAGTAEANVEAITDNQLSTTEIRMEEIAAAMRGEELEVAHEALIREWPRLRRWLDEDRDKLRLQRQISEDAHEWEENNRDPSFLYTGLRLNNAWEWVAANPAELNELEQAFIQLGVSAQEARAREIEEQREREAQILAERERVDEERRLNEERLAAQQRTNRIFRGATVIVSTFAIIAIIAAIFAIIRVNWR